MMICFSRPFINAGRIGFRVSQHSKVPRRNAYSVKFNNLDKESYLTKKSSYTPEFLPVFTLAVPLTAFILAGWQINRKQWKDQLVKDMELRTRIPAVELPEDLSDRRQFEYRRFKVRGRFDHSQEMYLGPRSLIKDREFEKTNTFLFPLGEQKIPNIGYYVVTPFKLSDRDVTILVNRGWVHNDKKDPQTRLEGQIEGEVELEGVLRLKEDKPSYSPDHQQLRVFRHRDLANMAELANTSFVFLDAVEESTVPNGPIGGQTQVNLKNDHMEYFLTWLTIGLCTSYMWHKRFIRKLN